WYRPEQAVDLPYLNGQVQDLLQFCTGSTGTANTAGRPVDPALLRLYDIKQPVYFAVLPWTDWIPTVQAPVPAFRDIPKFPAMRRDLALVLPISTPYRKLEEVASQEGGPYLESLQLFDVYSGKGLPEGHISYAIGLTFRHSEQTLTDAQIEETIQAMLVTFEKSLGARLRR
ncbi:MAG: hypothetical protein ACKO7V_12625, partial [Bacteroidota bacterium]